MIKKDKRLSYELGKDVFYISNLDKLNIIDNFVKSESFDYDTSELLLVEHNGESYLFGSSANSNWLGVKIDVDKFYNSKNKFYFYDRYFI